MGKHLEDLALRRKEEQSPQDPPHVHCEEWMAEIDAALDENSMRPPDD